MSIRIDIALLDHKYRARRTGQSKAEYASSVEIYKRPARQWPAYLLAAAFLMATVWMLKG